MLNKVSLLGLICCLSLVPSASLSLAFPGSDKTTGSEPAGTAKKPTTKQSPKAKKCKRGQTAKSMTQNGKRTNICVKLKAGVLQDNELYQNARLLADEGEYEWSLDHLRLMTNQNDAEVLNYTGYSNRKAGRLETGISYYHKALAVDPNYVQAREYLGEAYVLAGRIDLATAQLREIALRCGPKCETYAALATAIDAASN